MNFGKHIPSSAIYILKSKNEKEIQGILKHKQLIELLFSLREKYEVFLLQMQLWAASDYPSTSKSRQIIGPLTFKK